MTEIKVTDTAVQAAAEKQEARYGSEYSAGHLTWRDFADSAREDLEAAIPHLQVQVDREALDKLAAEWRQSADEDERYLNRAHASEIHDLYASIRINREHADAVLALLSPEETK